MIQVNYTLGSASDCDDVARLAEEVYKRKAAKWRMRLYQALQEQHFLLLVARQAGEPIGYGKAMYRSFALSAPETPSGYYLTGLAVLPEWRGKGIGTQLTAMRCDWIWERSNHAFCIIKERNAESLSLHQRLGFTDTAHRLMPVRGSCESRLLLCADAGAIEA